MEILKKEQYPEYEAFCKSHPQGGFTQSTLWYGVKNNWGHEVVVSRSETGEIVGLYILHPNNIGRCGHIANASYAVKADCRGKHIGEAIVSHSLEKAKELGFKLMQFNAVVAANHPAIHIYEKLGFIRLGTIPGGFHMKDGHYEDIILFYHTL